MSKEIRSYLRFALPQRIEHWIFVVSMAALAITGLAQKFAATTVAQSIVSILGGVESTRIIHHNAAIIMMLQTIYHVGVVSYKVYVLRIPMSMLPGLQDIRAAWKMLLHNFGYKNIKPQEGRYTFAEKAEYWAVVWGTVVMAITGFMMWNPIATTRFLPGDFIPAAKAAHGGEALLAVLAIIVWHLYHVHLRHFNKSMFTGKLTEDEMLAEHPLELADLKAGLPAKPNAVLVRKRQRIFFPVYSVAAAAMLLGTYLFVGVEETAITTLPPAEEVIIFAPLTPTPLPTPLPTRQPVPMGNTWVTGIGDLFSQKCGLCHAGETLMGGLDLSSYQTALEGGNSGPGIIPGNPDSSVLMTTQRAGGHPIQLSEEELSLIRKWIDGGAPEG
ncbi:MAG: cytochrome b/b6 domain-containing protein [Anaerolineales bacterium]|jgi:formate dehydrogenase gamma subunit|nr:cytochrome b/b6 domain-containing protein [Anaerolineales bacterium]